MNKVRRELFELSIEGGRLEWTGQRERFGELREVEQARVPEIVNQPMLSGLSEAEFENVGSVELSFFAGIVGQFSQLYFYC